MYLRGGYALIEFARGKQKYLVYLNNPKSTLARSAMLIMEKLHEFKHSLGSGLPSTVKS